MHHFVTACCFPWRLCAFARDFFPLDTYILPTPLECWYLTGPTAGGKSAVSIELARQLNAEIISLDSMAVYRGMDIGTAKPSMTERQEIPHHLIDVVDPDQDFSVAQYRDLALRAIVEIAARGRVVLFVGGTPLYLKAMLRGIFEGPPADWNYRRELEAEAAIQGSTLLHIRLSTIDPVAAAKLHPNDTRRMIRALEVHHLTGTPISTLQQQFEIGQPSEQCRVFVLDWAREILYDRIERRVDAMFAAGLVEETEQLLRRYPALSRTAGQAVGYREVIEYLRQRGARDEQRGVTISETIDLVKLRTRQIGRAHV